MNEIMGQFLPSAIWLIACAFLILLLLIIFGYHLYMRSRMQALVGDSSSVGQLAAQKEMLENEIREMRHILETHKNELLQTEAERHRQEVARADLLRLEKEVEEKRQISATVISELANLDNQLSRRKQALGRLDGEIKVLEIRKGEFEPMQQSLQDLRVELDKGNVKLTQLAEQELRIGAMMHQARGLAREIEELSATLEPLRQEKIRLQQFVDQARHASAVKNEQLIDQRKQIQNLEKHKSSVEAQIMSLEAQLADGRKEYAAQQEKFSVLEAGLSELEVEDREKRENLAREFAKLRENFQKELEEEMSAGKRALENMTRESQIEQLHLRQIQMTLENCQAEVTALTSRREILESEIERLNKSGSRKNGIKTKARMQMPLRTNRRINSRKIAGRSEKVLTD